MKTAALVVAAVLGFIAALVGFDWVHAEHWEGWIAASVAFGWLSFLLPPP